MHGPTWIHNQQQWPSWHHSSVSHLHAVAAISDDFQPQKQSPFTTGLHHTISVSNYSTLSHLLATMAYVRRFIFNLCNPGCKLTGPLSDTELNNARTAWVTDCQREVYWKELSSLTSTTQSKKRPPLVRQLHLFHDKEGMIRCGGRIHNAPLTELARFPYLIPPKHPFTALVVLSVHSPLYHTGVIGTLTAIRQSYWISTGRQYVKALLHKCITCKRHSGKPYGAPDPPLLPTNRTMDVAPFNITGIDFNGALYVRQDANEVKAYICLFTCATTRAIHLEVVTDLSTETYPLRCFSWLSVDSLVGNRSLQ